LEAALGAVTRAGGAARRMLCAAFAALQGADLERARADLAAAPDTPADAQHCEAVRALLRRRARLLARRPLPDRLPRAPVPLAELARLVRERRAFASHFPGHAGLRQDLDDARERAAAALDSVLETIAAHKRAARLAAARAEIAAAKDVITALAPLGGPLPALADGAAPSALQRAPQRLVALAEQDLDDAEARYRALLDELQAAERDLDVAAAAQTIDHAAAIWGGASDVVADLKDRLHRLTFFVDRLAQPADALAQLRHELSEADGADHRLAEVEQCFERCRR